MTTTNRQEAHPSESPNHRPWHHPTEEPLTTWRKLISEDMARHGEALKDTHGWATGTGQQPQDEHWLDQPFHSGHGVPEGIPFRMWTHGRVYFSHVYDGKETCQSVPRHPAQASPKDMKHVGTAP